MGFWNQFPIDMKDDSARKKLCKENDEKYLNYMEAENFRL